MISSYTLRNGGDFLLVALVAMMLISSCSAKQQIRLQSGSDCYMPGYYRDAQNCKKFYYCPYPRVEGSSPLTDDDKKILHEFTIRGLECPENSFFDESVSQCESFKMAKYIPVECKESHSGVHQPFTLNEEVNNGVVQEISSNNH